MRSKEMVAALVSTLDTGSDSSVGFGDQIRGLYFAPGSRFVVWRSFRSGSFCFFLCD